MSLTKQSVTHFMSVPCAHCLAAWSSIAINFRRTPALRGPPLVPCAWCTLVHPEHVTDVNRSGEAMEDVMLPVTSFMVTSLVLGQWWSGEAWMGRTDFYRLDNGILSVILVGGSSLHVVCLSSSLCLFPVFVFTTATKLKLNSAKENICNVSIDVNKSTMFCWILGMNMVDVKHWTL